MLRSFAAPRPLTFAAISLFALILGGCGGSGSASNGCASHHYTYVSGAGAVVAGAPWSVGAYGDGYGGSYGGGWYDPGDDGSDYSNDPGGSSGSSSSGDDGSGSSGGGSGDDGTYDDGSGSGSDGSGTSGNDGSNGDGTGSDGSGSDGTGSDGSGDDGSGDDGTASKKHLHTANVSIQTQSSPRANGCYAYSCTLVCVVGSPATQQREARGDSAISTNDACLTAAHGIETWAHRALGQDVTGCKQVNTDGSAPSTRSTGGARTPAAPSVQIAAGASGVAVTPALPAQQWAR